MENENTKHTAIIPYMNVPIINSLGCFTPVVESYESIACNYIM